MGFGQVGPAQIRPAQVSLFQVGSTQIDSRFNFIRPGNWSLQSNSRRPKTQQHLALVSSRYNFIISASASDPIALAAQGTTLFFAFYPRRLISRVGPVPRKSVGQIIDMGCLFRPHSPFLGRFIGTFAVFILTFVPPKTSITPVYDFIILVQDEFSPVFRPGP